VNKAKNGLNTRNSSYYDIEGYTYETVIHVPNAATFSEYGDPVFSPGLDVADEYIAYNDDDAYGDIVYGWYYDGNQQRVDVNVSESEAMSYSSPVMIATPDLADAQVSGLTISEIEKSIKPTVLQTRAGLNLKVTGAKINHRYERWGRSEFTIAGFSLNGNKSSVVQLLNGEVIFTNLFSGTTFFSGKRSIFDVSPSDIGRDISGHNIPLANVNDNTDVFYAFNTYERDWYTTTKPLGGFSAGSTGNNLNIAGLWGPRVYAHEWYSFNPAATSISAKAIRLTDVNPSVRVNFDEGKGYINFGR
jgi:hypothetical protein